jgi:RES domain-containing protein
LSLTVEEQMALQKLIKHNEPLSGTYFRSVERRFMDPTEILNGRGTELYGGRFAPVGTKAVYLADSDVGASTEVLARKKRLGDSSQISLDKYPRVVYAVDVHVDRVVKLIRKPRNPVLASIWTKSMESDIAYSQGIGRFLAHVGIQGLLFKSTIGKSTNLIVFLNNCHPTQLQVRQLTEIIDVFRQIGSAHIP